MEGPSLTLKYSKTLQQINIWFIEMSIKLD